MKEKKKKKNNVRNHRFGVRSYDAIAALRP